MYVLFPERMEMVVRVFLPAPLVRVTVVLPTVLRVVVRVPDFVVRTVVLPIESISCYNVAAMMPVERGI